MLATAMDVASAKELNERNEEGRLECDLPDHGDDDYACSRRDFEGWCSRIFFIDPVLGGVPAFEGCGVVVVVN